MPTAFEEITLGYKVASLVWEVGRSARNGIKTWKQKSKHRFISSLTTLEFVDSPDGPVAHWVQDRTVIITGDDVRMPPFTFGTAGADTPGQISITSKDGKTNHYDHRILNEGERPKIIGIKAERIFQRDSIIRCVFTATSVHGFDMPDENFRNTVTTQVEVSNMFIIFPASKLPTEIEVTFRKGWSDTSGDWRPVTVEKNELRQFTGGRKAFILEAKNPPIGNEYKVAWKW